MYLFKRTWAPLGTSVSASLLRTPCWFAGFLYTAAFPARMRTRGHGWGRKLRFHKVSHMWYRGKSSHYLFCSNHCSCYEELQKLWHTCWWKWPCATRHNNIQDLSDCLTSQNGKLRSEVRSLGQSPEVLNGGARISHQVSTLSPLHSILGSLGYK